MSVFTPVSVDEAREFIAPYAFGDIIDFQNIAAGVENSNFFVTTTLARYVLTIFEKIPRRDLDFYMGLMAHLHASGIACAVPLCPADGRVIRELKGKPAALVTRLAGNDISHPTLSDCQAVGRSLAHMHQAAQDFPLAMPNCRGQAWWRSYANDLASHLSAAENALLNDEIAHQSGFNELDLPRGVIHGDLFRDNILWEDHGPAHTPQMIDFYFACNEQLLFDVAITVNDWCLDYTVYPAAALNAANARAFLAAYAGVRRFTLAERMAWPQMLRAAALRTCLGRLGYHHFPRDSELTHPKDHAFAQRLLQRHREAENNNLALLPD